MPFRKPGHRADRATRRNLWRISMRVGEGNARRRPLWEVFNRVIGKPTMRVARS